MKGSRVLKGALLTLGIVTSAAFASVSSAQTLSGPSSGNTIVKKVSPKLGLPVTKNTFGLFFQLFPAMDEAGNASKCSHFLLLPTVEQPFDTYGKLNHIALKAKYEEVLALTRKMMKVGGVQTTRHKSICTVQTAEALQEEDIAVFDMVGRLVSSSVMPGRFLKGVASTIQDNRKYLTLQFQDIRSDNKGAKNCANIVWLTAPDKGPHGQDLRSYYRGLAGYDAQVTGVKRTAAGSYCSAEKIEITAGGKAVASATAPRGNAVAKKAIREAGTSREADKNVHAIIHSTWQNKLRLASTLRTGNVICQIMVPSAYFEMKPGDFNRWAEEVLPLIKKQVRFTNVRHDKKLNRRECYYDEVNLSEAPIRDADTVPDLKLAGASNGRVAGKLANAKYVSGTNGRRGTVVFLQDSGGNAITYKGCDRFWYAMPVTQTYAKTIFQLYAKRPSVSLTGISEAKDDTGRKVCFYRSLQ